MVQKKARHLIVFLDENNQEKNIWLYKTPLLKDSLVIFETKEGNRFIIPYSRLIKIKEVCDE